MDPEIAAFAKRHGLGDEAARELEALGDTLPAPLVTGADLRATELPAGPAYARILDQLLDEQLEGELTTREQALQRLRALAEQST